MKVVLTGAGGFLGKQVYNALLYRGHHVVPLLRHKTGLPNEVVFDFISGRYNEIESFIENCDCIIHLAAVVTFEEGFSTELYETNLNATFHITRLAALHNKHLIFSSSVSITPPVNGVVTKQSAEQPESSYALSKYLAERLIENIHSFSCILRIGGIYGYPGPEHLYLNKAIKNALVNNEAPTCAGRGDAKRNYIYVSDLADWIVFIVENKTTGKLLVAGNDIITVKEILSQLSDSYLKKTVSFVEGPDSSDFVIDGDVSPVELHTYKEAFLKLRDDFMSNKKV